MAKGKKNQVRAMNKWQEGSVLLMQCVQETGQKCSKRTLIGILLGNRRQAGKFQQVAQWGALKDRLSFKELICLFDFLEGEELIGQGLERGNVFVKERGKQFLADPSALQLNWEVLDCYRLPYAYGFFAHLRAVRRDLSQRLGVKPYRICSDALLERLATLRPKSMGFLHKEAKALLPYLPEPIWLEFLQAIRVYEEERRWVSVERRMEKTKHFAVKEMVEQNKPLEAIEGALKLKRSTILRYVEELSALGKLDPAGWLQKRGWVTKEVEEAARFIHHTGTRSWTGLTRCFRLTYEQFWASRILSHLCLSS
jgi:hypothetical protein